jgi:hypothetical protein
LFSLLHSSLNRKNLEPEYVTLLNRAIALGYTTPSAAQQVKQNQLIRSLKSAGIWTLLDVFYLFLNNGGSNFATLNWKSPAAFQATLVNSPTFTSNVGYATNGASSYVRINWSANGNGVNYTNNSASIGMYMSAGQGYAGCTNGPATSQMFLDCESGGSNSRGILNSSSPLCSSTNLTRTGLFHLQRTSSTTVKLMRVGAQIGINSAVTSTGTLTQNIYLGAYNDNGGVTQRRAGTYGCYFAGASLNGLESTLNTILNTYISNP